MASPQLKQTYATLADVPEQFRALFDVRADGAACIKPIDGLRPEADFLPVVEELRALRKVKTFALQRLRNRREHARARRKLRG